MPAGFKTPFMGSVTATTAAQDIFTLLSAIWTNLQHKACYVQIQLDPGAGGTALYVGGSNVSSTMCGASLVAGQANQQLAFDSNLLVLDQIFIRTDAGTAQVNLIVVTR
jgi:hypothetical protein